MIGLVLPCKAKKAVSAYFASERILPFCFAEQIGGLMICVQCNLCTQKNPLFSINQLLLFVFYEQESAGLP